MSEVAPATEAIAAIAAPVLGTSDGVSPTTGDTSSGDTPATTTTESSLEVSKETLQALAQQLEYYFSAVNLTRDTYLRTLRELNDGYVPATILANFAKVQSLCPFDSHSGVIKAATDYSDNLEVVHVDKESSKKVAEEGIHTLLAVGPKDLKPIELPAPLRPTLRVVPNVTASSPVPSQAAPGIQNTVILREVPEGVTEDDIRLLFDFEKCPPIQDVHEDLVNFWFVTFNTSLRDDMMNIMLALRSKTLKGESVKSRLKSGSIPAATVAANIVIPQIYAGDRNLPYNENSGSVNGAVFGNGNSSNKKKGIAVQQQQAPRSPKDGKKNNRRNNRSRSKGEASSSLAKHISQAPPPPLVESQFPSLEAPSVVIKAQQQPKEEDDEDKPMSSDGASTATTSTSSSVVGELGSKQKAPGGYVAALLKAKPPTPHATSGFAKETKTGNVKTPGKKPKNGNKKNTVPKVIEEKPEKKPTTKVETKAMTWGGARSFVDVIKNKENAATSS